MRTHLHTPGTVVQIDDDQQWSTCTEPTCSTPIARLFHDYDGDGEWHWATWGPAPIPVGDVPALGPAGSIAPDIATPGPRRLPSVA